MIFEKQKYSKSWISLLPTRLSVFAQTCREICLLLLATACCCCLLLAVHAKNFLLF